MKLKVEKNNLLKEKYSKEIKISLITTALKGSDTQEADKCPLCNHGLDKKTINTWKIDAEIEKLNISIDKTVSLHEELDKCVDSIKEINEDLPTVEKQLTALTKEHDVVSSELEIINARYLVLHKEIKNRDQLISDIKYNSEQIEKLLIKKGKYTETIISLKKEAKKAIEVLGEIKLLEKKINKDSFYSEAYTVVSDAFSRYAIPVQLLKNLRILIEKKSTIIYQYFTNGVIKIKDIEGTKPGIEFVMHDEVGARVYKALSKGEQVMMFLSIRVALMQIINATKNNKVDFLLLDEIAGNLSDSKREILARLTNSLLRKLFAQIFVVSHVELKDIFDESVYVTKRNDVSEIKVL